MSLNFTVSRQKHFNSLIFLLSISASILGIAASYVLFPQQASIISVFLTAFALLRVVNKLFDINRQEIWGNITTPYQANKKLGISLLVIFIGIMLGYGIVTLFLKPETTVILLDKQLGTYRNIGPEFSLVNINFGTFPQLLKHNFSVLLIVLFFALLYRTGGILLIIVWNASVWGVTFSYIVKNIIQISGIKKGLFTLLFTYFSVFLHLITESSAYILCAMTGFFMSKACIKYFKEPDKLLRVTKASLLIFIIAVIMIIVSAGIESQLTPKIVSLLFK